MNYKRLKNLYSKHSYPILPVKPGQYLEIHENVWDGDNVRIWKFKCLVIKVQKPQHPDGSFTVRGNVARMTIEKIYPLSFDKFDKVLLLDEYKVRRARLFYMRDKIGKDAKMKSILSADRKWIDLWELAVVEAEKNTPVERSDKESEKSNKDEELKVEEEDNDEKKEVMSDDVKVISEEVKKEGVKEEKSEEVKE